MKTIARFLAAVFAIGLCAGLLADEPRTYAQINFCVPGKSDGKQMTKDQFVTLVIDGPILTYESSPIGADHVGEFVDKLLDEKSVSYIGVYIREGTSYGDVMRAVDTLRKTKAKHIGLSVAEISASKNL